MIEYGELYKVDNSWYLYTDRKGEVLVLGDKAELVYVLEVLSKRKWELVCIEEQHQSTKNYILRRAI